ncbi:hypothetical protein [Mucilaginibacter sp.]
MKNLSCEMAKKAFYCRLSTFMAFYRLIQAQMVPGILGFEGKRSAKQRSTETGEIKNG